MKSIEVTTVKLQTSIVSVLQERAIRQADRTVFTFLQNGEIPKDTLTYRELDRQARSIAAVLLSTHKAGERALLIFPQGLEFICAFFGCLYAGIIAVPTPAPEANRFKYLLPRIEAIAQNSQATIILTTAKIIAGQADLPTKIERSAMYWLATDTIEDRADIDRGLPIITNDLAYLQYTSGSTMLPKGVEIGHQNLLHNLAWIARAYGIGDRSICATWVPHFHDYGLVGGLLIPVYAGVPCYLMSPLAFLKRPLSWLKTISKYRVTHSGGPNFSYDFCVRQIATAEIADLDLQSWHVAHTGAEPIHHQTLSRFATAFASYGFDEGAFFPSYGLAESTLVVTTKKIGEQPTAIAFSRAELARNRAMKVADSDPAIGILPSSDSIITLVGCGYPDRDTKLAIVQPQTLARLATDRVGEIWISSPSVANGYWHREAETNTAFNIALDDSKNELFLRTGDLGFIHNEQLFITGRLKDLIIIRGQNYYPEDIEWEVASSHIALSHNLNVVVAEEVMDIEQLVIIAEIDKSFYDSSSEIFTAIHRVVARSHQVPIARILLVKRGSIPKTSSGKIQRNKCLALALNGNFQPIATWTVDSLADRELTLPQNEVEFRLMTIWAKVLGISSINIKDNFFELGGDSLKAASVIAMVETFSPQLDLSAIVENPTIEQFASYLHRQVAWLQERRQLICLKSTGSKRPFYYIHPHSGSVVFAGKLASCFDSDRPMFAIQAVGLDGRQEPYNRIEDMAAHYLHEIRIVQPNGPYLLGGRCIGGTIAFEMAQQLTAQGERVLLVVNVEGPRTRMLDPIAEQRLNDDMKKMYDLNADRSSNFLKVMNAIDEAVSLYIPQVYHGRVAYFSTAEMMYDTSDGFGWASLTFGGLDIYKIPGTHLNLDVDPQVQILANILGDCLDKADRNYE
jgi:acyl-CoA synthetase (AMP-forming)/AMP-acid ligase II